MYEKHWTGKFKIGHRYSLIASNNKNARMLHKFYKNFKIWFPFLTHHATQTFKGLTETFPEAVKHY